MPRAESHLGRAIEIVKFVQSNKFWTVKDIEDHFGLKNKSARRIRDEIGNHYPVREARKIRTGIVGRRAALYTITPED